MEHDGIVIKPYTSQELAALYGVSRTTLRTWLKPHLPVIGHFFTTKQVKITFDCIGWPPGGNSPKWRDVA